MSNTNISKRISSNSYIVQSFRFYRVKNPKYRWYYEILIKIPILLTELHFILLRFYICNRYFGTNDDERFCEYRHISCFQSKLSHWLVHFNVDITIKIATIIRRPYQAMKICISYCQNILDWFVHFSENRFIREWLD